MNKLEDVLKKYPKERILLIIVTITNNSSGGQPVSMQNMKEIKQLANKYRVSVFFNSVPFAENAYFIKVCEKEYENHTIKEMYSSSYWWACNFY